MGKGTLGTCELCQRYEMELTFHHLIPKMMHSKKWCKRMFTREEQKTRGANLCHDCHPNIHKYITERDMARIYNTIEKLLEHPEVSKFVTWVAKQRKKAKR